MKKILALVCLLACSFSSAAQGYLTIEVFKNLSANKQRLVVIAARETMIFTLHNVEIHWLDKCISDLTDETVQTIIDTVVHVKGEELQASFVSSFVFLTGQLCVALQEQAQRAPPAPRLL